MQCFYEILYFQAVDDLLRSEAHTSTSRFNRIAPATFNSMKLFLKCGLMGTLLFVDTPCLLFY